MTRAPRRRAQACRRIVRALALSTLALAIPAAAQEAPATIEITTRPGDTCRSIAARVLGDPSAVSILHAHNPQLGPTPHHLAPGTILRVPAPGPAAELPAIHRRVERRAPDAAAFAAGQLGDPLERGTQVRTHEASSADITFRDRAHVTVREQTLVIVYGGRQRLVERPVTRAELERGALRSRLGELAGGRPLEVETPSSEARLGGDAVVSVEDDGTSRVANHGDRPATVLAGGARVVVPEGTGVVVRRGERPTAPRRLLAAPRWRTDHRGFVVGLAGLGATLRGGFHPVPGAARYRVEIARRPDGGELIAALELGAHATELEARGVPEGTMYVSVASIDESGLEGRRSPWRAFSIRLARLVSPGGVEPDLAASPPRVLAGTWLVAPRGLSCAIGEEPPTGIVTLRAAGSIAISCGNAGDDQAASERVSASRPVSSGSAPASAARRADHAVIDVDVTAPHVVIDGALERDRIATLSITLRGAAIPPAHVLALGVPEGFDPGILRNEGGVLRADVRAPIGAPDRAPIALVLLSGAERITLATVDVPVRDPATDDVAIGDAPPPPIERPRGLSRAPVVHGALGDLAWPSSLSLRDERLDGLSAWAYGAIVSTDGGDPQLRLGTGVRAQLSEVPLRVALATQTDLLATAHPPDRRGDVDLLASLGALVLDEPLASLAIDASAWLPTRGEPLSLGRVRLAPSVEASVRPTGWLALRTRQGALIDVRDDGARLWAFALGADLAPVPWLGLGIALDGSIGAFADRSGAALAAVIGAEARASALEIAVGARIAITDEARALCGEWSAILSLRLRARP